MASINRKDEKAVVQTHGGARTFEVDAEEKLYRTVMTCLLWEDVHYENGETIAQRIASLIPKVSPLRVAQIAIDARNLMKLRHVPLLIAREMAKLESHKGIVSKVLSEIIQRADELTEFLAIYWKEKKQPLSNQVRKGLSAAFKKFNEYSLAKYDSKGEKIRLRDVLFLVRPKSDTAEQKNLWKKLANDKLETPDTWEVEISKAGNNKNSWERLLKENKLGDLALIRNLRNMEKVNVNSDLIKSAINKMKGDRVLPFRYLFAALHAPKYESELEQALFRSLEGKEKLKGKTILIVDVSGSMYGTTVSKNSEVDRARVATSLAVLVRELCENAAIYATAGNDGSRIHKTQLVPSRRGFALSDAIFKLSEPLGGGGIFLTQVMDYVKKAETSADRIIVITDEQDCSGESDAPSRADAFGTYNYIINVNTYEHGIGYKKWTHINGWSEAVLDFIRINEEGYNQTKLSDCLQNKPSVEKKVTVVPKKKVTKMISKKKVSKVLTSDEKANIEEAAHKRQNLPSKKKVKKYELSN